MKRIQEGGVYARQAPIALENNALHRRRFVTCAEPIRCLPTSLKSRRELEAIDQKPPDWDGRQKKARSIGAAISARKQGKVRIAELFGPG